MKKKKITAICSALVFLGLFCVLFSWVNNVLRHKVKEVDAISTFYDQPKDTVDVILLGSSHAFLSMSPMDIWLKHGISSFNLGTPSQTLPCSYYLLKEAIRTQHPKAAVLEIYGVAYVSALPDIARMHMVTDCMPLNRNKIEMFHELLEPNFSEEELFGLWLPIFRYHSRWDSLESEDFFFQKGYLRGYKANYQYRRLEEPKLSEKKLEISEESLDYFERIVQLCEEEGIELLLCRVPMALDEHYSKRIRRMNTLLEKADELGIPAIDFEQLREEIGLVYETDFLDSQHMNALGARKVSAYLADYLKEHYDLEDYRGNSAYAVWERDAATYQASVKVGMENMEELTEAADDEAEDEQ